MENDVAKDKDMKNSIGNSLSMSPEEKFVSFLNNCFVFKKIRNVDTVNVENILTNESTIEGKMKKRNLKNFKKKVQKHKRKNLEVVK